MRTAMLIGLMLVSSMAQAAPAAATRPTTNRTVYDVTDVDHIKAAVGGEIVVRGKVTRVFTNPAGAMVIGFDGITPREFAVVVKKENVDAVAAGFGRDVEAAIKDKVIRVSGVVGLRNENPFIDLSKPEQMRVAGGAQGKAQAAAEASGDKDPLPTDSVWSGSSMIDRTPNEAAHSEQVKLKVLQRGEGIFRASYEVTNVDNTVSIFEIEGKIENQQIGWKVTKILKGVGAGKAPRVGTIEGKKIRVTFQGRNVHHEKTTGTIELTRDK